MKYYLCIVGNFDGNEEIYQECVSRSIYQYYEATHQKGAVTSIKSGDVLILTTNKQLKGYGFAAGPAVATNKGHDKHWHTIQVKGGWQLIDKEIPLPYGVFWHTIRGTKQSIVKELDSKWTTEIILRLKQLRHEGVEERAFPIHLSELATGLNTSNPFYTIPDIQRGLVWNATRCEVLWDSILRGIPIGAISVRPTSRLEPKWEIFDGQQRSYAAAMGYADWPTKEKGKKSILWIDLKPKNDHGRKFVLMVTTLAHPWGYSLSNDEKADNRLSAWEQRDAVRKLNGAWKGCKRKGARPSPEELWPVKAELPVPFSLLRQFVEEQPADEVVEYGDFFRYCLTNYPSHNWIRLFHVEGFSESDSFKKWISDPPPADFEEPNNWKAIVDAVRNLSKYTVVALNCESVQEDDLGLYFKRMNKQGIEPDEKELRYSMLKSMLKSNGPSLKEKVDELASRRTRPAWLADMAIKFWLSMQDGWKWKGNVNFKDIERVIKGKVDFVKFVTGDGEKDFPELLNKLDKSLLNKDTGLQTWHLGELYRYEKGEYLALYFLREIYESHSTASFAALAMTIFWFGDDIPKCAECLWMSQDVQSGVFHAMQGEYLARLFTKSDLEKWEKDILKKLKSDDWGSEDGVVQDPYVGAALSHIWDGFNGKNGCSFLLFACRYFVADYFGNYNFADPEWQEQNRPWDYDHILPKDWLSEGSRSRRISGYTYWVKKFLWSIGNSAPLPFSLNRQKNANPPYKYPDGQNESAIRLHVSWDDVNQFGKDKKRYDRLDRDKTASVNFVTATVKRIKLMLCEWYDSCNIARLLSLDACEDLRRIVFEKLRNEISQCESFADITCSVWFVNGERQYVIRDELDWARRWLALGICGTVSERETDRQIPCMLGVASDGKILEIGVRRHPSTTEIPGGEWWLDNQAKELDIDRLVVDDVVKTLMQIKEDLRFLPEK